jgi:cell wall-associated NlpC family hydrolase
VHGDPQPGDLLFFGDAEAEGERPISHVAISLGGSELIHANRTTGNVACNSVDAERPRYRAWLRDHLAGVRRFG